MLCFQLYSGNLDVRVSTRLRTSVRFDSDDGSRNTCAMQEATSAISASRKPRVVTAGLPRRMPLGFSGGFVSKGIPFLLTVM